MIVVLISGGLGNQLFQLAFYKFLADLDFPDLKVDIGYYKDQNSFSYFLYRKIRKIPKRRFSFEEELTDQIITRDALMGALFKYSLVIGIMKILCLFIPFKYLLFLSKAKIIRESDFLIGESDSGIVILDGYWQKSKYISQNREYIKRLLESKIKDLIEPNNSVVIHVRRGDQATLFSQNTYTVLDSSYYSAAIECIKLRGFDITNITICSDDIEWCKRNLSYLSIQYQVNYSIGTSIWEDFKIMFNATFLISSNSTFSYWAGYAGNCTNMIIPLNWYVSNPTNFLGDLDKIIEI